jgi:hypothetical protein
MLRQELDLFLHAVRRADEERRSYERIPAHGMPARLQQGWGMNHPRHGGRLVDLSRGGALVDAALVVQDGEQIGLLLPGIEAILPARVIRCGGGQVALSFRQDAETLEHADRIVAELPERAA